MYNFEDLCTVKISLSKVRKKLKRFGSGMEIKFSARLTVKKKEPSFNPFQIWNLMSGLGNIVYHGKILFKTFPWSKAETSFSNKCHKFKEVHICDNVLTSISK